VKIYTRTGDGGETSLFDGTRVSKADLRVDAYGEVDELSAWLGLARASPLDADLDAALANIQRDLFALGARLADPAAKIAARVGKPSAGRAVARACATNKLAVVIPCHRVIRADGSAAGYRWIPASYQLNL